MPRIRHREAELSTEANIGKILILVGIILQAIGVAASFAMGSLWMG